MNENWNDFYGRVQRQCREAGWTETDAERIWALGVAAFKAVREAGVVLMPDAHSADRFFCNSCGAEYQTDSESLCRAQTKGVFCNGIIVRRRRK